MQASIVIDDKLMEEALEVSGAKTESEVMDTALRTLVRLKRQESIRELRGKIRWEGDLDAMRTDK